MASSDIYADLEMQTSPEIYPLRSRFYISLNDADKLKKGDTFKKLPKEIIIFICTNDPFHRGYAKIYLNAKHLKDAEHQNVCEELANLLEYVETSVVKDSFTKEVDCQVKNVNKTEGDFLMTLHEKLQAERTEGVAEGRKQGIEQGIEKGTSKEKIATVRRMAKKNMPISDIAEFTDLSTDEVQKNLNTIAK